VSPAALKDRGKAAAPWRIASKLHERVAALAGDRGRGASEGRGKTRGHIVVATR